MFLTLLWAILLILLLLFLWAVCYPLVICYYYKYKHGKKVYVLYYPILGYFKYRLDGQRLHKDVIHCKRYVAYNFPEVEVIVTHVFSRPYFVFIKPEKAKILLYNYGNYKKRTDEIFRDIIACRGLAYAEGQTWKDQRRELSDFFTYEQLSSRIPVVKQLVKSTLQFEENKRINIISECSKITSRTMQICFFNQLEDEKINGRCLSQEFQELAKQFITITYGSLIHQARSFLGIKAVSTMSRIFMTTQEKQFLQKVLDVRAYINKLIDNHKPSSNNDVFTLLLKEGLTDEIRENIIHQYITFVFAGMDTTSHITAMSLYMLAKHQDIQNQLRNELMSLDYDQIDQKILNSLPLLNAFLNECLRTQTPSDGIVPRLSVRDHYVGEFFIKNDWYIDAGLQPMMTHANYFQNSQEFDITRWLKGPESEAFIPFSYGPRNCIGQHLAKIEARLIIIFILKTYKVIVDEQTDLVMETSFLYAPQDDRLVKFERL